MKKNVIKIVKYGPTEREPLVNIGGHLTQEGHYAWLDLLRFIAAMLVVLAHTRGAVFVDWGSLEEGSQNALVAFFFAGTRLGHEAVLIFFVLSGYLVGGRVLERIATKTFHPDAYAIDRISRIWVPLLPALVISGLLAENAEGWPIWLGNVLGLQGALVPSLGGNAPLWSLAYEIWFYVIAYAVGRQSQTQKLDPFAVLLLLAAFVVFSRLQYHYLVCWLLGAYVFYKKPNFSITTTMIVSVFLCVVGIVGIQARGPLSMGVDEVRGLHAVFEIALSLGSALLCSMLVRLPPPRFGKLFSYMAGFSYTLYLVHAPILLFISRHYLERRTLVDLGGMGIFIAMVALFLGVSWIMYLLFERNTHVARRWLRALVVGRRPASLERA